MNTTAVVVKLVERLESFVLGIDESVQWAKDTESLLDQLEEDDEVIDELQSYLSLYRPEGGDCLYNKKQMGQFCTQIIPILRRRI